MKYLLIRICKLLRWVSLISIIVFFAVGCTAQPIANNAIASSSPENPFETIESELSGGFGFGVSYPEYGTNLIYNGVPVNLEYYINCDDNRGGSYGLILFVNGIPQPYSVEGSREAYIHIQQVEEDKTKNVSVSFVPVTGEKGDNLCVRLALMESPDIRPTKPNFVFGYTNSVIDIWPRFLQMESDVPVPNEIEVASGTAMREMTADEYESVFYLGSADDEVILPDVVTAYIRNADEPDLNYFDIANGSISMKIQVFGGSPAEYYLIPYINHEPLLTEEFPRRIVIEDGNLLFEETISVDFSSLDIRNYNLEEYNSLYYLLVPVEKDNGLMIVDSNDMVIVCSEE